MKIKDYTIHQIESIIKECVKSCEKVDERKNFDWFCAFINGNLRIAYCWDQGIYYDKEPDPVFRKDPVYNSLDGMVKVLGEESIDKLTREIEDILSQVNSEPFDEFAEVD